MDGQGNLEKTWKVREKSVNVKINGYGSFQKIMYSVRWGKDVQSFDRFRRTFNRSYGIL